MSVHTSKKRRETPPGFRPVKVNGRICYSARHNPEVLYHHELLREFLQQKYGLQIHFPDQMECLAKHKGNRFFLRVDIKNAFASVRVFPALSALDLPPGVEEFHYFFFHQDGGLIEGAPCSPLLFNLYFQTTVENELASWAKERNLTWSRYVDDILFSGNKFIHKKELGSLTRLLARHGFVLNRRKTRLADSHREPVEYLGAVIYRGRFDVTDEFRQKLTLLRNQLPESRREYDGLNAWKKRVLALNR